MKLILFDIDGTLIHSGGAGRRALERAIKEHYGISQGLANVRLDGKTDPEIIREALVASRFDARHHPLDPAFREVYSVYLQEELTACLDFRVLPGVPDLLQRMIAESTLHVGLATGNMQEGAALKLERAGLQHFFRFGGYGCDSADRTEVILSAITRGRTQLKLRHTIDVVIGDTPRDVEHGKRAGAQVIAVATGHYEATELWESGADLVLNSLDPVEEVLDFLRD